MIPSLNAPFRTCCRPILWLLLCGQLVAARNQPGSITLNARIDTTFATIGDHLHLTVALTYPKGTRFILPQLSKKLGAFEILDLALTDMTPTRNHITQNWTLTLTCFDTGRVTIPTLEFQAIPPNDTTRILHFATDPLTITLISVLPPGTTEPKDIKPPFPLPKIIPWDIVALILIIAGLLTGWLLLYRRWKRRRLPVPINEQFLEPPHSLAFRQLRELQQTHPVSVAERRYYLERLSFIFREYFERRWFIRALEMSTTEIQSALRILVTEPSLCNEIGQLLSQMDIFKFANQTPTHEELNTFWGNIYLSIDKTKHEPFLFRRTP